MASHKILNISFLNCALQEKLSQELRISPILAQVLINRQVTTLKEADDFLNPHPKHLLDPFKFQSMAKAVNLIKQAAKNKEKTLIFGDYDADGITAVAILKDNLSKMGLDIMHQIPHRVKEGYGLNKNILHLAKEKKVKLLITVDCGISNFLEVEELRRNNTDVIITDHHEPSSTKLPHASSIINPKVENSGYPFRELAGVGVAYKLCQALNNSRLLDELDLVSLGTIADSVALRGENRFIAKEGLARLPKTKRKGLRVLIENAGIENKKFTSTFVSFILAPRINASGRVDSAETSLKLLMSQTEEEARELAKYIEGYNRQRQKIESKIMEEAQDLINKEVNFKEHKIIVIAKEDWHQGVLGIVASKIADRFYRPAIVISLNEDLCKGSARSIKSFHLFNALKNSQEYLHAFGGHSHAAGLMISKESIADFKDSINRFANEELSIEDLLPSLEIDMEVFLSDLNLETILELEQLEPFGSGNPEPLFFTRNLKLKGEPQILGRETLKFRVTDGTRTIQAIGFGMSSLCESLKQANDFDLVYSPRIDSWQGNEAPILEVRDIFFR